MVTEYKIVRLENVLTLRRTKTGLLSTLVGSLFPLAGLIFVGRGFLMPPVDKLMLFFYCVLCCGMAFVLYRLTIWGRCVVFDRANDQILIDSRKVCSLSDLASVQLKDYQNRKMFSIRVSLCRLHLRTVWEDIILKSVSKRAPEYGKVMELVRTITEFTCVRNSKE